MVILHYFGGRGGRIRADESFCALPVYPGVIELLMDQFYF